MSTLSSLKVDGILTKPLTVDLAEPVSKAIGILKRSEAYEVLAVEKNLVAGLVAIRDILRVKDIRTSKVSNVMTRVPLLSRNETIAKTARMMTEHRVRTLPVVENRRLIGQITARAICDRIAEQRRLDLTAASIMTPDPVSLKEDDLVSKARTVMITRSIDHLPVLGGREVMGIVTSDAIVFRMTPPERIAPESIVGEEQRRLDLRVSGMMTADPTVSAPDTDIRQVIEQMRNRGTAYSLVALWGELQGIITYRDCVKILAEPREESLPISIVGLPDDPFEAEAAKEKFERVVKRLARSLHDIIEARSVIKESERAGHRRRYEVKVELVTPRKTLFYELSGWNLAELFDELSERMKRITVKKPGSRKERRR